MRWAAKLAVAALAAAFAVGIFEVGLRTFAHVAPQLELDIYRKDSDGLLLLRPSVTRRHVAPAWDVTIRINSAGWRDDESAPKAEDYVILGLGDSQAFGWGVELDQTFYSIVEKRLRKTRPTRLIKADVPATATVDQVKVLERLMPIYHPHEVMLAFFVGNDFVDNAAGGSDRLEVRNGLLTLRPRGGENPGAVERAKQWVAMHSHVAQLLRAVQFNFRRSRSRALGAADWDDVWMRDFAQIHLKHPNEMTRRGIEITLRSLDRAVALCEANSVKRLVLIVLPRSLQVYPAEAEEMRAALGVPPDELALDAAEDLFRKWRAGTHSSVEVSLVDALPLFRAEAETGSSLYYTPDAHMSPEGHAAAAKAVLESLATP